MKRNQILCLLAAIAIIASCKKDDAKINSSSIEGTYKFQALKAKTNSTITSTDGEKMVTLSDYSSTDNKGTIVFDNSKVTSTGLSYSINTVATGYYYEDNELIDSLSSPFSFSVPSSNSVSTYQLIGADSIYFPKGGFASIGSTNTTTNAGGGHYKISGNLLTLNLSGTKDSTFTDTGIMYQMKESVITSIVLEKQ